MDNEQTIDSFVDALNLPDADVEVGSSPDTEASSEAVTDAPETVAPDQVVSAEVSSTEVVQDAGATVPTEAPAPDPALLARLEAAEAQARAASERAEQSEKIIQQAQAEAQRRAYEQARQAQDAEFQARALQIENITDPDMQKREAARLVAEVQQARTAEAQVVLQQREQQLAQMEMDNERTAAIAAGFYQTIQNRTDLTEAQKNEILTDTKYYAKYPSPQAQQEAIERDRSLVSTAVARAKAEWEKAQGQAMEAKVAARTAADTDLVGSATGSAGGRPKTIDDFVDSLGW